MLNIVVTGFGIFETIRYYKLEQAKNFSYSNGFTAGIIAGAVATIIFCAELCVEMGVVLLKFLFNRLREFGP